MDHHYDKFRNKSIGDKIKDLRFHFIKTLLFPAFYYVLVEAAYRVFDFVNSKPTYNWFLVVALMLVMVWQFYKKTKILEIELENIKGESS